MAMHDLHDSMEMQHFDRELTLADLLMGMDGAQLLAALQGVLAGPVRLLDERGQPVLGGGMPVAARRVAVRGELEPLGHLEAAAPEEHLRAAARLLEFILRGAARYRMAADLHLETVREDYRELERRHEALQQSEARYRELAANLEQRVAEQVATIDQTRRQLYQSEKLAAVGQLAAGVAHEINNPIGFISSNLTTAQTYLGKLETVVRRVEAGEPPTVLQQACRDEDMDYVLTDFASLLEESLDGSRRVARIVNDLKGFSRVDGAAVALEDVNDVIRAVCNVTRSQTEGQVEVLLELHPLPKLSCNAAALGQVIYNLLINAVQVTSGRQGAQVRITTFEQDMHIHVTVADNGPGISADVLPRIFEPFFTTKEVGQGTGLGLTVCVDVVHAHGGRIDVQSGKTGTAFSLYLPVTGAPWSEASKGR